MKWDKLTIAAAAPVAIVAVIAGLVSYGHIEALALAHHQTLAAARLLPFSVDFLIVAGSVIILAGYPLGWLGVVTGVAATLFANVESGIPFGWLSATIAGWPAAAFTVASFILERWLHRQVSDTRRAAPEVASNDNNVLLAQPPAEPEMATLDQPEPEVATCGHEVAGTPEENVVRAYLHERDCLAGKPSQRALAKTYNVSRPKVAALVGSLNGNGQEGQ